VAALGQLRTCIQNYKPLPSFEDGSSSPFLHLWNLSSFSPPQFPSSKFSRYASSCSWQLARPLPEYASKASRLWKALSGTVRAICTLACTCFGQSEKSPFSRTMVSIILVEVYFMVQNVEMAPCSPIYRQRAPVLVSPSAVKSA